MPSPQTAVDYRGYYFQFPTLGLPDRSGEYFPARMVIASKDIGAQNVSRLFCSAVDFPRRYAPKDCPTAQVEYEGTVWIIPLLVPQKAFPETEVFTIKCRRELASTMPPKASRLKVPDGELLFAAAHPNGMGGFHTKRTTTPTAATEADEKAFWQQTLSPIFSPNSSKGGLTSFGNLYKALPSAAERGKLNKGAAEDLLDWVEKPEHVLDREWLKEAMEHAAKLAEICNAPRSAKGLGVALRALAPSGGGGKGSVCFEVAVVFDEDDTPSWHEWKEVPSHGFRPGYAAALTKQVKEVRAKKGKKEVQWRTYRTGAAPGSTSGTKKKKKAGKE